MGSTLNWEARVYITRSSVDHAACYPLSINEYRVSTENTHLRGQTPMTFVNNALYNTLNKFMVAGLKFFIVFIIARNLGPAGQGEYSFFLTVWSMSFGFFSYGIETATNYYTANATQKMFREIIGNILFLAIVLPIVPALLILGVDQISDYFAEIKNNFHLIFIGLSIVFLETFARGPLYGSAKFKVLFWGSFVQHFFVLLSLSLLWFFGKLDMASVMITWIIGLLIALSIWSYEILQLVKYKISISLDVMKMQASYGTKALLLTALNSMNLRIDAFLIMHFWGLEALGLYSFAVVFMEIILYIPHALARVILTEVSAKGTLDPMIVRNVSGILLLVMLAVALVVPPVIYFFFEAFIPSIPLFLILMPAGYSMGMAYLFSYYLLGKEQLKVPAQASFAAFLITIVLNIILLPLIGLYGAAIASLFSYSAYFYVQYRTVAKQGIFTIWPSFDLLFKGLSTLHQRLLHRKNNE